MYYICLYTTKSRDSVSIIISAWIVLQRWKLLGANPLCFEQGRLTSIHKHISSAICEFIWHSSQCSTSIVNNLLCRNVFPCCTLWVCNAHASKCILFHIVAYCCTGQECSILFSPKQWSGLSKASISTWWNISFLIIVHS